MALTTWHDLHNVERLEALLAEMAEDNKRLRQRVAELEAEVNESHAAHSPELEAQGLMHAQEE